MAPSPIQARFQKRPRRPPAQRFTAAEPMISSVGNSEIFKFFAGSAREAWPKSFWRNRSRLKRPVALKVLRGNLVENDPLLLKRFEQEAKAAANLNHANIVQVYAVGAENAIHYIVQEYVSGVTLREWLRRNGPPEPMVAIRILRQAALGLQAAEEANIVHRDIKPENILLTRKGAVKVGDFGLAQLAPQQGDELRLTKVGLTMGTPLYMSPEQVAGKAVDHRSDLYSLGITAYQLLAGTPPFRGDTALSVAIQHMNSLPEPLAALRPDLPRSLCQIVHKLIEKKPETRYQSATDLAADLRALSNTLRTGTASAVKKDLAAFTVARKVPRVDHAAEMVSGFFGWSFRKHALMLLLAFLLLGSVSAAAGWITRPANPLDTAPADEKVERAPDAWGQFRAATIANSVENWRAVIDYFPENATFTPTAKVRLAVLYLQQGKLSEAEALFRSLTTASSLDPRHKANGYAGLATLAAVRDDKETYQKIVQRDILTLGVRSVDRDLGNYLEEAYARNQDLFEKNGTAVDFEDLLQKAAAAQERPEATP